MASPKAIWKFIQSLRPYISKGLISVEEVFIHLNKKGVKVDDIVRKAVNNAFKKAAPKDPLFNKTKIDLPLDDEGLPFNPSKPLANLAKQKKGDLSILERAEKIKGMGKKLGELDDERRAIYGNRPTKEEWVAKKNKENKEAVERFKQKNKPQSLFATPEEYASDLTSLRMNITKNNPNFNLQIIEKYKNPGIRTYAPFPDEKPGKLLSPQQRQETLDEMKELFKHEEYQQQFGEDFDFTEITDDMFRIEKADGGSIGLNYLMGL